MRRRGRRGAQLIVGLVAVGALAAPCAANANEPWWHTTTNERPAYLPPACRKVSAGQGKYKDPGCSESAKAGTGEFEKGMGQVAIFVSNLGDADANAETNPVVIKDRLPEGLKPTGDEAVASFHDAGTSITDAGFGSVTCKLHSPPAEPETVTCIVAGTHKGTAARRCRTCCRRSP